MENEPKVGDIWRWSGESTWTVLLTKKLYANNFRGIALEDGWEGPWKFDGPFVDEWEYLA
jgi:hypothetical protein